MVRSLALFLGGCERLFLALANTILLVILAINIVNILSRLLFDLGVIWVFPWTRVLFVWMIFLAFFVIYRRGKDVTVDFFVKKLSEGGQRAVRVVVDFVALGLILVILAQIPTLLPRQVGHLDLVGIQRYWLALPFYISCVLILLEFVLDLLRALRLAPEEVRS